MTEDAEALQVAVTEVGGGFQVFRLHGSRVVLGFDICDRVI